MMNDKMLGHVIVFLSIKSIFVYGFSNNADEDYSFNLYEQNCVCVPFWQCKDDFSGLFEEGMAFADTRTMHNSSGKTCPGDFDVCCKLDCGKKRNVPSVNSRKMRPNNGLGFRILGADSDAEFGEFPWMLGLLDGNVYKCGASLIHRKVAITAAHCLGRYGRYSLRAGEWNWESKTEPLPHQDRKVVEVIIHPRYDRNSLANDIAILILNEPYQLYENIGVICLSKKPVIYGENCIASGWGKNMYQTGTYQSILKKVTLPIVPHEKCLRSLQEAKLGPTFNLHKSFLCAGGEQNKDTCKGDGGSPLICPVKGEPDRYEQVGIVSWGLTCGISNAPGVYVNVALYVDWIDREMELHYLDSDVYRY